MADSRNIRRTRAKGRTLGRGGGEGRRREEGKRGQARQKRGREVNTQVKRGDRRREVGGVGGGERFISRNCIGICMAISILELTYLEMFSLAEIHGRLLRPGPLGPRGPRTYSLAQPGLTRQFCKVNPVTNLT